NHDLMSRSHIRSLPCEANSRNSTGDSLILPEVRSTNWIHQGSTSLGLILCLTLALILLPANGLQACEDEPNSHSAKDSSASNTAAVSWPAAKAEPMVIGFVGGFIRHDEGVHSTVIVAKTLKKDYAGSVRVGTFKNRRISDARNLVMKALAAGHRREPTA